MDGLTLEWRPSNTGAGIHSPIATCIDPAGDVASVNQSSYQDLIKCFSRLRSLKMHDSSAKGARSHINYKGWIMQTCPQAFLQTVDPSSSVGERVYYPSGSINTAPVIRMTAQIVLGDALSSKTPLGFLRVNAHLSVRGRRGLPLSGT